MRLKKLSTALSLAAVSTLSALSIGGCVEDRTTLFIAGVYSFAGESSCEADASLGASQLATGLYDPGSGAPYMMYIIVGNGIQPLGDNDTLRPETSRILVDRAVIDIQRPQGGTVLEFTQNISFMINPEASEEPGLAAVGFPAIPANAGVDNGQYNVEITVFGETLGGIDLESSPFVFPVIVSEGTALTCDAIDDIDGERLHPCGPGILAQDGFTGSCDGLNTSACGGC